MKTVTLTSLALLTVCVCSVNSKENENFVSLVTQSYKDSINTLLETQIKYELSASYIYQAYASYFQRADVSLPGAKKFFSDASLEERGHAQMLIDYINSRGGHVEFQDISVQSACKTIYDKLPASAKPLTEATRMCICQFVSSTVHIAKCVERAQWKEGLMAFEDTLAIERFVNDELLKLHTAADQAPDPHLTHILEHHFLDEQVKSINQLAHYVTRLKSFSKANYKLGEYIFDQSLLKSN